VDHYPAVCSVACSSAALIAFVWTTALVAQRFGIHEPSPTAGALTVLAVLAILTLPRSITLLTTLDDPAWTRVAPTLDRTARHPCRRRGARNPRPSRPSVRRFATPRPHQQSWRLLDDEAI
jgi:hypothetical protein